MRSRATLAQREGENEVVSSQANTERTLNKEEPEFLKNRYDSRNSSARNCTRTREKESRTKVRRSPGRLKEDKCIEKRKRKDGSGGRKRGSERTRTRSGRSGSDGSEIAETGSNVARNSSEGSSMDDEEESGAHNLFHLFRKSERGEIEDDTRRDT